MCQTSPRQSAPARPTFRTIKSLLVREASIDRRGARVKRGNLRDRELPSIVVPSTGWSIDSIASYIRSFFRIESRWNVSGDITIMDQKLWLHLRMNGRDLYTSATGVDSQHPDDLFGPAAQKVIENTDPYILAASISRIDESRSVEIAERIISDWPATDPSVAWAHNLIGNTLYDQGKKDDAMAEYREAIRLQPRFGLPHTSLGIVLNAEGKSEEAVTECQKGIDLDPKSPSAHAGFCYVLGVMHKSEAAKTECDTAINEYRMSIETDPYEPTPHVKMALLLRSLGRTDQAIKEFRTALDLAPHDVLTHIDLGLTMLQQGKIKDAVVEFQKAIEINPRLPTTHRSLSKALSLQGNEESAKAELEKALALEGSH
jgi:tetratricopeptide (TPR) repeat protein